MPAEKMPRKLKTQNKPVDMIGKEDRDWKPSSSYYHCQESSQNTSTNISDEESSDQDLLNSCPVCQKSFSRGAALICHVKQCHCYILAKPGETNVRLLKRQIVEWQSRREKKEKPGVASRSSASQDTTSSEEDTSNKKGLSRLRKVNYKEDSDEGIYDEVDENDKELYPLIGGSVSHDGVLSRGQLTSDKTSTISFEKENTELLDPDQSFSIVRNGNQNKKRTHRKRKMGRFKSKPYVSLESEESSSDSVKSDSFDLDKKPRFQMPTIPGAKLELIFPPRPNLLKEFAKIDISIDNSAAEEKQFKCPLCIKSFSSSILLTYHHMRIHVPNELQQCPHCGKCFYTNDSYKDHYNSHRVKKAKKR